MEVSKLASERSKSLRVARDDKERIRTFKEYKPRFDGLYTDRDKERSKKKKKGRL